jgi:hypothetical protein
MKKKITARVMAIVVALLMILAIAAPLATTAYADEVDSDETYIDETPTSDTEQTPADGTWTNQMMDTDLTVEPENPNNGVIVFCVASMPEDALDRTVRATIAYGPADETLAAVKLNGMNSFVGSVELEPHSYFCSYFVTNDPAMDYPVEARSDDMYSIDVTPGSCKVVYLDVSGESFYEQITGKKRYYEAESTIETEDGFDTNATGQIGCYLTVPETFGDTVVVYVENLFTGAVKELDLYDSNNYSAYASDVAQGRYKVVGTRVLAEGDKRFVLQSEQETITTNDTEGFHLTVYDSDHPEAKMVTPSRDNNSIVQEAEQINGDNSEEVEATPEPTVEPTPAPVQVEEPAKGINIGMVIAIAICTVVCISAAVIGYLWYKNQHDY